MQNIEYKSELRNLDAARRQCDLLGADRIGTLRQTDVYYRLADGRLKRRTAPGEPVEWIYYHRSDQVDPKLSNYTILTEEQARRRWGTASLHAWVTVRKTRELWMLDGVRIHLDEVDDLGTFIEFESMVSDEFDDDACHSATTELRQIFSPLLGEPVAVSYCDLMHQLKQTAE